MEHTEEDHDTPPSFEKVQSQILKQLEQFSESAHLQSEINQKRKELAIK